MTTSDLERRSPGNGARRPVAPAPQPATAPETGEGRAAPARPPLSGKEGAPIIVKRPAPASVRMSQLSWVLSLAVSAFAVVYLFVIRTPQLPEIVEIIRGVDGSRADETYETAADIVFWVVFGAFVALWLVQVTLLVSFSNRRPNTRWWLLGTLLFQGLAFLACRELVALGQRGAPLVQIQLLALGLAVVGLLFAALPGALRWTARQHDVGRSPGVAPSVTRD
ncbi:hypothetical protein [Microbacterium sp. 10M-3C3]|jgi:hypothetical protein|uniref:hypothetical protein n=1 Tax=Microbacterium sp. 10M-3C3 TaxID=2483401 RepID=UPI000F6305AB|nr:hypothetical protein [Microbacterium sp. 10M-3C3]